MLASSRLAPGTQVSGQQHDGQPGGVDREATAGLLPCPPADPSLRGLPACSRESACRTCVVADGYQRLGASALDQSAIAERLVCR